MAKPVPARISGIVASDAPVAVIFRRGPTRLVQMLRWNLETDDIEPGQWMNAKIFLRRCDLSPDGSLLVGAYSNYTAKKAEKARAEYGTYSWQSSFWTAVSRPPYFSALAFWFMGPSYNGGGIWETNKVLGFNNQPYEYIIGKRLGPGYYFKELNLGPGEDHDIWNLLLKKRGWIVDSEVWQRKGKFIDGLRRKPFATGEIRYIENHKDAKKTWKWWEIETTLELRDLDDVVHRSWKLEKEDEPWVEIDLRGRVLIGENGCLYAWEGFPKGEPKLVADLNGYKFEEVSPPDWATRW